MNPQIQRFCPLCDRPFTEGEAVLRCEGCAVLHHPACWVKNDGCATQGEHTRAPQAQAYTSQRPLAHQAPHPGEGTRRMSRPGAPVPTAVPPDVIDEGIVPAEPVAPARPASPPPSAMVTERIPVRPPVAAPAPPPVEPEAPEPVIGEAQTLMPPPVRRRPRPEPMEEFQPPRAPKRYQPPPGADGSPVRKPLPKLYGTHRWLGYWYVPAGVALAVIVAAGIIWAGEKLTGGGDTADDGAEVVIPAPSPTVPATPTAATAVASTSPVASATARVTAPPGVRFAVNQVAIVTGAGDCLNVRTKAGRENDAIVCLPDGAEVTVKGGPEEAGGLRWWRVQTPLGEGWAAEDYLVPKP